MRVMPVCMRWNTFEANFKNSLMKTRNSIVVMALAGLLVCSACKKEEDEVKLPDFSGVWTAISLRDECPDASKNVTISSSANGICLAGTGGGQDCIRVIITLNKDKSFSWNTKSIKVSAAGVAATTSDKTDTGTFTATAESFTTCTPSGSCTTFQIAGSETAVDWLVTTTSAGGKRYYRLTKS